MVISSPTNTDCVVIDSDEAYDAAELANIDHQSDVTLGVSEYTHDIYKYLRQAEVISFSSFSYYYHCDAEYEGKWLCTVECKLLFNLSFIVSLVGGKALVVNVINKNVGKGEKRFHI